MTTFMKNTAILILILTLVFLSCGGNDKVTYIEQQEELNAGDIIFFNADGAGFIMVYVPGKTFKTGKDDSGTGTVNTAFWIGETEVTYELWYKVCRWAADNSYAIFNAGREGHGGTTGAEPTNMQPVTAISWRDAMLWCNAATEWYNAKNGTNYTCTYYSDAAYTSPIRTSTNTSSVNMNDGSEDKPYIIAAADGNFDMANCISNGFRLPTSDEWELAARYVNDDNNDGDISENGEYYPGNYASGAMADCDNAGANQAVAWYNANSAGTGSHEVKGFAANALGLYDMSGNLWELCFDWYSGHEGEYRISRGGSWFNNNTALQVGRNMTGDPPYFIDYGIYVGGFRIAQSAYAD